MTRHLTDAIFRGMTNPYYNPSSLGLHIITSYDQGESYEFDMFVLFQDEDGRFFYATDSGCSCYSPFEYFNEGDLYPVDALHEVRRAIHDWARSPSTANELISDARSAGLR